MSEAAVISHPRDVFALNGAEAAEQAWLDALERGRMHHAWLLVGPEGIGKATFAYRAARRLLGARPDASHGLLGSDPDHPVTRQPPRGVLFLVCHAPGRLLPTLRSRCRRLLFRPWPDAEVAAFAVEQGGLSPEEAERIAPMAQGAPGRAITLARAKALEVDHAAHELLRQLPQADESTLLALAGEFRGAAGQERFDLLFERLAQQVKAMIEGTVGRPGSGPLPPWLDAWDLLTRLPAEAEALNLDRQDAFWTAVAALRQAARA